jgi:inorganic pyrophosphatase
MEEDIEQIESLQKELCNLISEITEHYPDYENQLYIKNHLDILVDSCNFWSRAENAERIKYDILNSFNQLSSCFPC